MTVDWSNDFQPEPRRHIDLDHKGRSNGHLCLHLSEDGLLSIAAVSAESGTSEVLIKLDELNEAAAMLTARNAELWPEKSDLTFRDFSHVNLTRCLEEFHTLDEWSPTDWGCAVAGEVGEALNLLKKKRRGEEVDTVQIGYELADAVTYIDLLCQALGLNLGSLVAEKFNIVSRRIGSPILLEGAS